MSENKYIGITIGPIEDTIKKAQKTREIWGASYIFSYMCKRIMERIDEELYTILLPNKIALSHVRPEVGLYPDRILLLINDVDIKKGSEKYGSLDDINNILLNVRESIANELWNEINKTSFTYKPYSKHISDFKTNKPAVLDFLSTYFKTYAIEAKEKDLNFIDNEGNPIGIVKSLNLYLDYAELMPTLAHYDPDPFHVLFHFINHSFLVRDAFGVNNRNGFPSLTEIAVNELIFVKDVNKSNIAEKEIKAILIKDLKDLKKRENEPQINVSQIETDFDEILIDEEDQKDTESLSQIFKINKINKYLRTYHKYIAIIHADGDNMGKLIGNLGNPADIQKFSAMLLDFALKVNLTLAGKRFTDENSENWGYGAAPIFIGGDELIFFAPVASIDENGIYMTIFDLIHKIDTLFNSIFNEKNSENKYVHFTKLNENRPCLSYGLSISYYKFPLREAFEQSKLLMYDVKKDLYKTRNRLNFILQKHSGQKYQGILDKNYEDNFNNFCKLLKSNIKAPEGEKAEIFLNSVHKNIIENKGQYLDTLVTDLTPLFKNNFNEDVHIEFQDYLTEVRIWIEGMLRKQKYTEETLDTICSMLKFIHFVRDNEFRH